MNRRDLPSTQGKRRAFPNAGIGKWSEARYTTVTRDQTGAWRLFDPQTGWYSAERYNSEAEARAALQEATK